MRATEGWLVALMTNRGGVRADNQDAVAVDDRLFAGDMGEPWSGRLNGAAHALMVADGIAGQPHGATASSAALRYLGGRAAELADAVGCEQALHGANEHVYASMTTPETVGMGTTLAGVALTAGALVWFNVGDSRVYQFGSGGLVRLSQDDVVADGGDGRSHQLTQAFGGSVFPLGILPHVGTAAAPLRRGEGVLVCSDGLSDAIDDRAIAAVLDGAVTPAAKVSELVRRALAAGGPDNLSVLVAEPAGALRRSPSSSSPSARRR